MRERKYGKKSTVSLNPYDYSMYLIGEPGIGKTWIIKEYCERLVGEDGYMFIVCNKESDFTTIEGMVRENAQDWETFDEITRYLIENKFTDDYKDMKIVVIDTYDALTKMAEDEALRIWNRDNPDKKTKSFKATYGGFNGPTDKVNSLIIDRLWELKRCGLQPILIGHTKRSDYTDPVTMQTYSMLSTDIDKRYFNALKNNVDFGGVAYIDRTIDKVKTGKRNVVTNKDEIIGKITNERRVICFRDDSYALDSKSRFSEIQEKIAFDPDALIEAIRDALRKERAKGGISYDKAVELQKKADAELEKDQEAKSAKYAEKYKTDDKEELESKRAEWIEYIQDKYPDATKEQKANLREALSGAGGMKLNDPDLPIEVLKACFESVN